MSAELVLVNVCVLINVSKCVCVLVNVLVNMCVLVNV